MIYFTVLPDPEAGGTSENNPVTPRGLVSGISAGVAGLLLGVIIAVVIFIALKRKRCVCS